MSLFAESTQDDYVDHIIDQVQELAHRFNDAMKLHETLLALEVRKAHELRNEYSRELGRLVQAVADLRREDEPRHRDELGAYNERETC